MRRGRRAHRQLPKRFRDVLPEPPLPLPPQDIVPREVNVVPVANHHSLAPVVTPDQPSSLPTSDPIVQFVEPPPVKEHQAVVATQANSFGLFRLYDEGSIPAHDPEDQSGGDPQPGVPVEVVESPEDSPENPFHPYPNESSWRLGDWYWNQGTQKSKKGFQSLVEIIGGPSFQSEDLRCTNWTAVDRQLGCSGIPGTSCVPPSISVSDSQGWLPEEDGWKQRTITISVPFPRRSVHPGPRDYSISTFYRRSLLSIIRDKLADPLRCKYFRFEPYLLRWKCSRMADDSDTGVYGEIFYSQAFIAAHRQLQDAPPDLASNCALPRRIVALMFWSDATQLTSFGDAKLWPLYVYFGNESKYQRSNPNANLCSHVAYFQAVSDRCLLRLVTNCCSNSVT